MPVCELKKVYKCESVCVWNVQVNEDINVRAYEHMYMFMFM